MGEFGKVFFWGRPEMLRLGAVFVVKRSGDGHLFLDCTFPPIVHVGELPEFMPLMTRDRSKWLRCLLWHGWLLGLSDAGERDPWAAYLGLLADRSLEQVLSAYPVDDSDFWAPPDFWDADDLALGWRIIPPFGLMAVGEDHPIGGFELADAGVFLPAPEEAMRGARWGTAEEHGDAWLVRCRVFMPVPGPLQTVQRAELWGAILALQAFSPGHLGIDNLNVVRSIGRSLDHGSLSKPLPVVKDGDLISLVHHMIRVRGQDTVKVTKVKGHATETDVEQGRVGLEAGLGTLRLMLLRTWGRRHQLEEGMDVRRALLDARELWYPSVLQLHRFMVGFFFCVSRLTTMDVVVRPLIRWSGTMGVVVSSAGLTLGLMLILLRFLALLVS